MCEPRRSNKPLMVGSAALAGCLLAVGAYAKTAPVKAVEAVKPAPPVVHAGTPWWLPVVWALAGVAAAILVAVVVRVVRRRRTVPVVAPTQARRALGQRAQRAIEAPIRAQAFVDGKVDAR